MPCYSEWDAYLTKGTNEYEEAKTKLEAKLKSVKHIIDYYYNTKGFLVPEAKHSGKKAMFIEQVHEEFESSSPYLNNETPIIEAIAHHCICDGIHFTDMYDLATLLEMKDAKEAGYARVIYSVANGIRRGDFD